MRLRTLLPQDSLHLADLLARIPTFDAEDRAVAIELVKQAIRNPDQKDYDFIVAASAAGSVIGYICFGPTPLTYGTYDLYWIAVDPAYTDQGVGTLLLSAFEEKVRQVHGRMIIVETSSGPDYEQTRHFYLKNGYHLAETIPDFFHDGEDRVTYIKRFNTRS
ncbi:MAG TPA: N-acetyltransferase [Anaerolineaceae bacterium]